jgi:uncharacterized protein
MSRAPVTGARRRRFRCGVLCAGAVLALAFVLIARAAEELPVFRIGTAATTGTYFQIGGVLASAISKPSGTRDCGRGGGCGVPGLSAVAQATQGSIENVLAVGSGHLESALAQSDVAFWAYTGRSITSDRCHPAAFPPTRPTGTALLRSHGPQTALRAIAGLYPEDLHIIVRAESAIRAILDLRGKRVALGEPESGTLADARLVLGAAGLTECDLKPRYLTLSQAAAALEANEIDAFFEVAGFPVPAVADVAAATPIRLLPIPADVAARLTAAYPFLMTDMIPAGTYPGVEDNTETVAVTALWIVGAGVPDDLVYAITKALWQTSTLRLLAGAHSAGRRIALASALTGVVIPLHPGAARYYTEVGMTLPAPPR